VGKGSNRKKRGDREVSEILWHTHREYIARFLRSF
jgi:hypothetical protein